MKRRDFLGKMGCSAAGLIAAQIAFASETSEAQGKKQGKIPKSPYRIDVEIYEAREDSWCHKKGEEFRYPEDWGHLCALLRASMMPLILCMEFGVLLPWSYKGTPYEKVVNPSGVTTEYVRCPDPTSDLVAKIIQTRIS